MKKEELIERIIDAITDPYTDDPDDYMDIDPIDVEYAKGMLKDIREMETACDLDDDERLPEEVTPELVMEAFNCLLRSRKYNRGARIHNLARYLRDNECVCEHDMYYGEYPNNDPCVVPVNFICNELKGGFYFDDGVSIDDIIEIGMNSKGTFSFDDAYCWFDDEKRQLFSSDTPFADGVIDAEAMAEYIIDDRDALEYFLNGVMDDDEIMSVFGCRREEVI